MSLNKKMLFAAMALKTKTVKLPEGEVILQELCSTDYLETYEHPAVKAQDGSFDLPKFTALLITRCMVDEKGKRILVDEDVEQLRKGSTAIYLKLADAARELNGLSGKLGNSEPGQSVASPSA
jgi:hypothetical protein